MIGDAAGNNQLEIAQVGRDVEGEAVRGDAARNVNADGADFGFFFRIATRTRRAPDAGQAVDAPGLHAKLAAKTNQRLFHPVHKILRPHAAAACVAQSAQVEDGIAHQLAGAVIGHVAAAADLVNGDAAAGQQLVRGKNVRAVRVTAQRNHRRMFEQKQHVPDAALGDERGHLRLEAQTFAVLHAAEIKRLNHRL